MFLKISKMRLVGSITTLPSRISSIVEPVKYILRQKCPLEILYLNIPLKTKKGKKYVIPKNFLKHFEGFYTKVLLNRCKDYGPITKLAPTLLLETHPDTYIITFDDDIIIHSQLVEKLISKITHYPKACLGFSGICMGFFPFYFQFAIDNKKDCYVDWIQGVHVVAYKRSFFTSMEELIAFGDETSLKKELLLNDDHKVSLYLASKNIPRISIGCDIQTLLFKYKEKQNDALSARRISLVKEHYKIVNYFSRKKLYCKYYRTTRSLVFLILFGLGTGIVIFKLAYRFPNLARIGIMTLIILTLRLYFTKKLALKQYSKILLFSNLNT